MFKIWDNYAGWKVLRFFLSNPSRQFYLRKAAKEAGVSTVSASTYLEEYAKAGVLEREKRGNLLEFRLNGDSEFSKLLKRTYGLYLARESKAVEKILEREPNASTICLYGSYANGTYDEKSDFDLLVISPSEPKGIKINLLNGNYPSILCVSPEKWRKLNPDFKSSVLKSYTILYGSRVVEI